MANEFFEHPILNSPYEYPSRHWELDDAGQPTQNIIDRRRAAKFITPIPKPKKRKAVGQSRLLFNEGKGLSTKEQEYETDSNINEVRQRVDAWRSLPNPNQWQVTPETARLLQHWRHHKFSDIRPFFCQVEAAETAIWLIEVATQSANGKRILDKLGAANKDANPELLRFALKLATGAGKTTVMAMLIAWQTINAARHPAGKNFSRGFLVCTPGLTIKDRLRVLQPNDPDSYYASRELVPGDMLDDVKKAKIVITNYHAFMLRERIEISKGGRQLLQGRTGEELKTLETEGQMIQRVMPELMGMKNILVINDEAHHCYREKPKDIDDETLKGDEKKEAEKNNEAARTWISGLEAVNRKLGLSRVIDLSATPFFLRGSGYGEGTLFTWTVSDFSLMDAIECGIVKLPRVPVAENIPGKEMPMFRDLWENIRNEMPKKGRGKGEELDPLKLPTRLQTALEALYGHYAKTFKLWEDNGIKVPPCFIIVCQNTAISKLVYDFISGFHRKNDDGTTTLVNGRHALFRNFDETTGNPLPRPNTLLIDSEQLEAGDALDDNFRGMAADEIERFRREIVERSGDARAGDNITDQGLLREVMNTVGKPGQLGGAIRCVVSVSMLTEGWDANTVTHVLGIRAFGTQLLCEQVIGRALRRQSYELNEDGPDKGLFNVEYADIFGIPFDFTARPVIAPPQPPRETVQVKAIRPERDALEIRFPRVEGYRVELPEERLTADFNDDSILELSPDLVGPSITRNSGIIGEGVDLSLEHLADMRPSTLVFHLTHRLLYTKWRDSGEEPKLYLFGQLKRVAKQWLDTCLVCKGGTYPAQLMYQELADIACNRITDAITRKFLGERLIKALLDPYNPTGSTFYVRFNTSRADRWDTSGPPPKNQVNWVVLDSDWEAEFCRVAESHPKVIAYTKNHNLGLEVTYRYGSEPRKYLPDFIVLVDDGHGADDPLHLVVEIKGYRREDAKEKKSTMDTYWIPGVNHLGTYGRWAFAEFTDVYQIESGFKAKVESEFNKMIESATAQLAAGN
ncbi:MAG: DEAD/DEAH box helicase family protein [Candidatus Binatus sp.]|uniref:BPTD_3080 family restriction endonuclease n=1 Tax=Candidatus Binatus sp. TaxID=2811406 RepID=UPI00271ED5DD|nr:DEAD/DEAH box helicase family protein [Candidatus Binatus sp.]MDO8431338.1 DEAD/DEAH box helicase family protein [Candidatus Binatus sp.]